MEKTKINLIFVLILFAGFLTRVYFFEKVIIGDIFNYQEWGQKLVENGSKNYYFAKDWYYSPPVYPPVAILSYGLSYYLYEQKFLIAQLHNLIHFPPSTFIVYFYKFGYVFLLKLPSALSDLVLSVLIYKLIFKLTNDSKRSLFGFLFYLFNPISIFLSGAWGQSDSLIALIGLGAFLLALNKNLIISLPLMFLGIYFKPSWLILMPFYFYVIYLVKPRFSQIIAGSLLALAIFILATLPFSDKNVFSYGWQLFTKRYPLPIGSSVKASTSAFNFQTIFHKLDIDYAKGSFGIFAYLIINALAFVNFKKQKNKLHWVLSGIFIIGMGSFLFMPGMLERYFFPALVPLIILAFSIPKLVWNLIVMNTIFFLNIFYAFYRRTWDEMHHLFIDHNFLLIRVISIILVLNYFVALKRLQSAKIKEWKK